MNQKIIEKSKNDPHNDYLGPSFLNLLDYLWKSNQNEYSPKEIHDILKKIMRDNYNSNDVGLIIKNILNQLNEELNNNPIETKKDNDPMDQYNKELDFTKFYDNIKKNMKFISEKFYSFIELKKRCTNNKHGIYYEYYFGTSPIIDIYLETNNNNIPIELSFECFKSLLTDKENQTIKEPCALCESKEQTKILSKDIITTSEVLIININRKNDKNNTISFNYPEEFSGNKIINKDNNYNLPDYELTTVIKRDIRNYEYKFLLYYKSFIDNNWYLYNNEKIELIQTKISLELKIKKNEEIISNEKKNKNNYQKEINELKKEINELKEEINIKKEEIIKLKKEIEIKDKNEISQNIEEIKESKEEPQIIEETPNDNKEDKPSDEKVDIKEENQDKEKNEEIPLKIEEINEIKKDESPIIEEKENNIKEEEPKPVTNIEQNKESSTIEQNNLEIKEQRPEKTNEITDKNNNKKNEKEEDELGEEEEEEYDEEEEEEDDDEDMKKVDLIIEKLLSVKG